MSNFLFLRILLSPSYIEQRGGANIGHIYSEVMWINSVSGVISGTTKHYTSLSSACLSISHNGFHKPIVGCCFASF